MRKFQSAEHPILFLSCVPPVLLGFLILKYGIDLIDWDQWEVAAFFEKASHGALTLGDLFAQQAEFRQFFPNLIFLGLGWLTHWNIKYEMLVSFLLACLVAFNVYRLAEFTVAGSRSWHLLLTFISNLLIFSPAQFESWLLGEQIIYFLPVACLTTCLRIAYSHISQQAKFIICMLLSTVSTFSSANGIVCWLLIPPVLLFTPIKKSHKPWFFVLWGLSFGLNVAGYFYDFHKPTFTPSLAESSYHPVRALLFFLASLGAPLATSNRLMIVTAIIGAVLASLFLMSCIYVLKFTNDPTLKRRLTTWLMLGAYSFITAIILTIARLGFGPERAVQSRYTTFSVYLLVALCYLLPIIINDLRSKDRLFWLTIQTPRLYSIALSVLILLHVTNSAAAIRQMYWMKIRRLQAKACLLFVNSVPDECLTKGFPDLSIVRERANAINDLGFLRPSLIKGNRIEGLVDTTNVGSGSCGSFANLNKSAERTFTATGWASLPAGGEPADVVLLTYQKDEGAAVIFALAEMRIEQPSFAALLTKAPSSDWRWQKSFPLDRVPVAPPVSLSAWAFDAKTGKAYKLNGTYVIENNGDDFHFRETESP